MAKAFQCDRCGELEQGDPARRVVHAPSTNAATGLPQEVLELCSHCLAGLYDWLSITPATTSDTNDA